MKTELVTVFELKTRGGIGCRTRFWRIYGSHMAIRSSTMAFMPLIVNSHRGLDEYASRTGDELIVEIPPVPQDVSHRDRAH